MVHSAALAACGTDGRGLKPWPEPPPMLAMLTSIQSAGGGLTSVQSVGGESEDHTCEEAYKGSTLALKPRADITRSPKTRVPVTL